MTFSLIDATIIASDALHRVRRRVAGSRDSVGRYTPGAELVALVAMDVQTRAHNLDRDVTGDSSEGGVDIWATAEQLAAAYLEGDVGETPLGWTTLLVAPAEHSEGPAGDRVEWLNAGELRIYEITTLEPYDETGPLIASGRKYGAEDRGAA